MKKIIILFLTFHIFYGCTQKKEKWVFILAGQSNMAGRGIVEPQDTIIDPTIFTLTKDMELVVAKEPLHFYEPKLTGLDCGLSFSKELKKSIPNNIEIILVPCAVGGSSIDQWLGDSLHRNVKLYSNFKERMNYAKTLGTIKGVLWHQGESDANPTKLQHYQAKAEKLFQNFRSDIANEKLPIIIGELGEYTEPKERKNNWKILNKILHKIAENDKEISVISSKGLKSNPDKIHFNSEAQRELGKRYAKQYLTILN